MLHDPHILSSGIRAYYHMIYMLKCWYLQVLWIQILLITNIIFKHMNGCKCYGHCCKYCNLVECVHCGVLSAVTMEARLRLKMFSAVSMEARLWLKMLSAITMEVGLRLKMFNVVTTEAMLQLKLPQCTIHTRCILDNVYICLLDLVLQITCNSYVLIECMLVIHTRIDHGLSLHLWFVIIIKFIIILM